MRASRHGFTLAGCHKSLQILSQGMSDGDTDDVCREPEAGSAMDLCDTDLYPGTSELWVAGDNPRSHTNGGVNVLPALPSASMTVLVNKTPRQIPDS